MEQIQYWILENHPADSRVKICDDGIFQTLSSRMGTGGGNVPMVLEVRTIQNTTGTLSPGAHAGSYNGQDAYSDMLVIDDGLLHRERTNSTAENKREGGNTELHARSTGNYRGGVTS